MKLPQCVDLEDVDNMSQFSKSSMRETNDVFVEVSRRCRAILTCDQSEFALVESVYTEMSDSPFFL
jgi:peroxiredoxin